MAAPCRVSTSGTRASSREMVKRERTVIDLTADEDDEEHVAQRVKVEEPYHLLCPITREMFRDPVMLPESGHTYERAAIERHLHIRQTDPMTNVWITSTSINLVTNMAMRDTVQAWLDEKPGITPDGWETREMLPVTRVPRDVASAKFASAKALVLSVKSRTNSTVYRSFLDVISDYKSGKLRKEDAFSKFLRVFDGYPRLADEFMDFTGIRKYSWICN